MRPLHLTSAFGSISSFKWEALFDKIDTHLDNIKDTPQPQNSLGIYSMIGLSVVLAALALYAGGFQVMLSDLPSFLDGNALDLVRGNVVFGTSIATIVAMVVVSLGCAQLISLVLGERSGEHAIAKELANMTMGNHFASLTLTVFAEELFARALCIGLLTKIPFLSGTVGFYAMFLLGNSVWAAIHLANFTKKEDRNLLRVLPQFLGGVFLTFIYMKYGFTTALMVHLGFDALVFAVHKREDVTAADFIVAGYAALIAAVAFWCMNQPLTGILPWFQDHAQTFALAGWGFWDYFKADLFITLTLTSLFSLLLFDRPTFEKRVDAGQLALIMIAGGAIAVAFFYALFWSLGLLTHSMDLRAILVGLLVACLQRGRSGSSIARAFWCTIPSVFISLCVLEAVGFWATMAIALTEYAIELPIFLMMEPTPQADPANK